LLGDARLAVGGFGQRGQGALGQHVFGNHVDALGDAGQAFDLAGLGCYGDLRGDGAQNQSHVEFDRLLAPHLN
jgi:hypothetical protein